MSDWLSELKEQRRKKEEEEVRLGREYQKLQNKKRFYFWERGYSHWKENKLKEEAYARNKEAIEDIYNCIKGYIDKVKRIREIHVRCYKDSGNIGILGYKDSRESSPIRTIWVVPQGDKLEARFYPDDERERHSNTSVHISKVSDSDIGDWVKWAATGTK